MNYKTSFLHSANKRVTATDLRKMKLYKIVINHISAQTIRQDAETIWLELKAIGVSISFSTFNNDLKRLVNVGMIVKTVERNKSFYMSKTT